MQSPKHLIYFLAGLRDYCRGYDVVLLVKQFGYFYGFTPTLLICFCRGIKNRIILDYHNYKNPKPQLAFVDVEDIPF